ncbi:MAG TPA: hypothetical protein DDY31_14535 [Lachnospiraceae bacterium]|nr:hypothetical protein [Lachnospiraceae bacterium]
MGARDGNLLDILMEERIHKGLEKALNDNELYQSAQKEVDEAINKLGDAGLSREQNKIVDKAISAANASGAAYGATAYRQGFYDGIKLMLEIKQVSQAGDILEKRDPDCEKAM